MARDTYVCFGCKQKFHLKDMIEYTPLGTKHSHRYCMECYEDKIKKEKFSNEICRIFGLRAPGPLIYSQRKYLNDRGFTDEVILKTLHYMFDVKGMKRSYESLGLVNRKNAEEAWYYYKDLEKKMEDNPNADEIKVNVKEIKVKVKDKRKEPKLINPNDFLDMED